MSVGSIFQWLFFSHTSGVDEMDAGAILAGISKVSRELRSKIPIVNFGAFHLSDAPFGNADWYQNQSLLPRQRGFGLQADALMIDQLLRDEPYQKQNPHLDVMAVDHDLTGGGNNFVYGSTCYPNVVISTRRFKSRISDPDLRIIALAVLSGHELGHLYGLVGRNFNLVNILGSHCNGESGPCLMEQVDVGGRSRTIEAQSRLIAGRVKWLCPDCEDEAAFKREDLQSKGILW